MSAPTVSTTSTLLQRITPECKNMANRSSTLNMFTILFATIAIVLMIVALVYNYMPIKEGSGPTKEQKTKIIGWMNIVALILVVITAGIASWQITVNKAVQNCINSKNTM